MLIEKNASQMHVHLCTFSFVKGTVSREWGEHLMLKTDKIHLFNVAADGLFSILIAFS